MTVWLARPLMLWLMELCDTGGMTRTLPPSACCTLALPWMTRVAWSCSGPGRAAEAGRCGSSSGSRRRSSDRCRSGNAARSTLHTHAHLHICHLLLRLPQLLPKGPHRAAQHAAHCLAHQAAHEAAAAKARVLCGVAPSGEGGV